MSSSVSQSDIAISAHGVSKAYTIRHNAPSHTTLGDALLGMVRHPLRRLGRETFWALEDVSFEVPRGEVVGILGRNGAGKSTLLKILSRITRPTTGEVDLYGRVGSLLEVGTGFHQELTGRENIFLNGAILGMGRAEIKSQFDAIVDFAGVEKFLDTPVKRYSSGMYVRLAFAVAAHLRSEIMVVDEVLAVGDTEFQRKCLGKMKDVATSGRTVLFVSHNMQSMMSLCQHGLLLEAGKSIFFGSLPDAVELYSESMTGHSAVADEAELLRRPGTGQYRFISAAFDQAIYRSDETKRLRFRMRRSRGELVSLFVIADLRDAMGNVIFHADSRMQGVTSGDGDVIDGMFEFRSPWLKPGRYNVTLEIASGADR